MSFRFSSPIAVVISLALLVLILVLAFGVYTEKTVSLTDSVDVVTEPVIEVAAVSNRFPVGVDPEQKLITEDPTVDWYVTKYLSIDTSPSRPQKFLARLLSNLAKSNFLQQLASPMSRIIVIYAGERKEEVIDNIGDILRWTTEERTRFSTLVTDIEPILIDGKFYPGHYTVSKDASPEDIALLLNEKFQAEIFNRYDTVVSSQVPLTDALIIASLLEREAYDFTDMRIISGVIWNRLFIGMPLQLDATLQYAKASEESTAKWWPQVRPEDKYINSSFNTYENKGLPPSPIANPSLEAVVAALNPKVTECLYYFHDDDANFYCNETYEGHVADLEAVFGQGR